ncbi:MAG: HPr(Ser) kinase/phosphatase [Spirochaetales bacterium]|jgi:HPr kinase/phosphorylase|nr:HPr(Ser) kinase/phosphatase [Spirochaetales bacterium]
MKIFTVLDLMALDLREHDDLQLRCTAAKQGLSRCIAMPDINRPGLALSGFFDDFAFQRVQLMGRGEQDYIEKLFKEGSCETVNKFFEFGHKKAGEEMPCVIFSHAKNPNQRFVELCEKWGCPLLTTELPTSNFSARLVRALGDVFAPQEKMHAVMVEVFGVGVLILGDSGVGKSEAALELIERGHRLVADDTVEVRCVSGNILMGQGPNKNISHHMEIRGLGFINIANLYGVASIRDKKQIQLVVELEEWQTGKTYHRMDIDGKDFSMSADPGEESGRGKLTETVILDVHIPYVKIPIKPGRNISILIETAAKNERLKELGYHSDKEFDQKVMKWNEEYSARVFHQINNLY